MLKPPRQPWRLSFFRFAKIRMPNFMSPHVRYSAFSNFLSGVSLFPRTHPPQNRVHDFFDLKHGLFCGVADETDLTQLLQDTGMLQAWKKQGHEKIWLTFQNDAEDCHVLSVWTEYQAQAELLMHAILWLEYLQIDRLDMIVPSLCVEHLRLQNPRASFSHPHQPMPGQTFPSSGLFRNAFAIAQNIATRTGALCLTEVPQFFHTAWLFSPPFQYIDPRTAAIYEKTKKDLLPPVPTFSDVLRVSRAFEAHRVFCNHNVWYWPTELQAMPLDHQLCFDTSFELEDESFVIADNDECPVT